MGKNTPERQEFIIENLKIEGDLLEEMNEAAMASTDESMLEIEEEAVV